MHALTAVCSVIFDLRDGQSMDACVPEGALSQEEISSISYLSLPDSMSFELTTVGSVRDTCFRFRIPRSNEPSSALHGFVFCRQTRRDDLPRGGEQRAVVLVSSLPLGSVLNQLATYAGPLALGRGPEALQQVYDEVNAWPSLQWGGVMELPANFAPFQEINLPCPSSLPPDAIVPAAASAALLGDDLHEMALIAGLDADTGLPLSLLRSPLPHADNNDDDAFFAGPDADADVFTPFATCLPHLWALWEAVLLGQPLLVVSPLPSLASAAVVALASLVSPMPYCLDYRPYFCVHDEYFHTLAAAKGLSCPETHSTVLIGITNPQILKAVPQWPNALVSGYTAATQQPGGPRFSHHEFSNTVGDGGTRAGPFAGVFRSVRAPVESMLRRQAAPVDKALETTQIHRKDGLWMSYSALCRPDHAFLSTLGKYNAADDIPARIRHANSRAIRKHFHDLTLAVLQPLLPLITPAAPPLDAGPDVLASPSPLPPIDAEALVADIFKGRAVMPDVLMHRFGSKRVVAEFYARLMASPQLRAWLDLRRAAAETWQALVWRDAWRAAGGAAGAAGVQHAKEVAAMESFLSLEAKVKSASLETQGGANAAQNLSLERLRRVFASLPPDLQDALLLDGQRAGMLQQRE